MTTIPDSTQEEIDSWSDYFKKDLGQRVEIIDVTGETRTILDETVELRTPDVSKPHINRRGTIVGFASEDYLCSPKIQLDDGTILYGFECWWRRVKDE